MIPRISKEALFNLRRFIETGDLSEGWIQEPTSHPYKLKGTSGGLEIVTDGHDHIARVHFGHTRGYGIIRWELPFVDIVREGPEYNWTYEKQGYILLKLPQHPTWTWPCTLSIAVGDTDVIECHDVNEAPISITATSRNKSPQKDLFGF